MIGATGWYAIRSWLNRHVRYGVLIQRRDWNAVTWFQGILLFFYVAGNGILLGYPWPDGPPLDRRAAVAASLNVIPVFLTNPLADFAGLSLQSYYIAHHWTARVAVVQGLVHGGLALRSGINASGLALLILFAVILLSSIWVLRKWFPRLFPKSHLILALLTVVALSWHVLLAPGSGLLKAPPIISASLWAVGVWIRVGRILFYGGGKLTQAVADNQPLAGATHLKISLSRDVGLHPGAYFYIFFPKFPRTERFRGFPMAVYLSKAWIPEEPPTKPEESPKKSEGSPKKSEGSSTESEEASSPPVVGRRHGPGSGKVVRQIVDNGSRGRISFSTEASGAFDVSFLIRDSLALSRIREGKLKHVILDGPYGKNLRLERFDTVLLAAEGIGIAGVLPFALFLAQRRRHDIVEKDIMRREVKERNERLGQNYMRGYQQRKQEEYKSIARRLFCDATRVIKLFWVMEDIAQETWINDHVKALMNDGYEEWFINAFLYWPEPVPKVMPEGHFKVPQRFLDYWQRVYVPWTEQERTLHHQISWGFGSPGSCAVVACGTAGFTQSVRDVVAKERRIIQFFEVEFQPRRKSDHHQETRRGKDPDTREHIPRDIELGHLPLWQPDRGVEQLPRKAKESTKAAPQAGRKQGGRRVRIEDVRRVDIGPMI